MSMSLRFHTVSNTDITEILENPLKLYILYNGHYQDDSVMNEIGNDKNKSLLNWTPKIESETFFVDGMFQSLQYILTEEIEWNKSEFPFNFLSGKRIDIGEIGWGKATFYNSEDVNTISNYLKNIDYIEIRKRYNSEIFNEKKFYPSGYNWSENDADRLIIKLKELSEFISNTNEKGLGIYRVLI